MFYEMGVKFSPDFKKYIDTLVDLIDYEQQNINNILNKENGTEQ